MYANSLNIYFMKIINWERKGNFKFLSGQYISPSYVKLVSSNASEPTFIICSNNLLTFWTYVLHRFTQQKPLLGLFGSNRGHF